MKNDFPESELLNFEVLDPEEYEGKTIIINDAEYLVGKHIGSGNSSFVHKLINKKSKLSLNVIKVWRDDIDSFRESLSNQIIIQQRFADEEDSPVPIFTGIEQCGGAFFLQENFAGIDDEQSELMSKAFDAVKKGNLNLGIEVCNIILVNNRFHTEALNLSAHIQSRLNKPSIALDYLLECVSIEPNHLNYLKNAIRISYSLGYLNITKILFEQMKSIFPSNNTDDNIGAELYLNMGEPEVALELLESHLEESLVSVHFSKQEMKEKSKLLIELKNIAQKELENKMAFHEHLKKAGDNIGLIKSAFDLYDKDILPSLNYGTYLLKHDEYDFGINLLARQVYRTSQLARRSCLANMAFYSIKNNRIEKGMEYLSYLANEIISSGIKLWDLPSVAEEYKKGGIILESTPDVALQIIDEGIAKYSKTHNNVPPEILTLRKLYKEHVDSYQK